MNPTPTHDSAGKESTWTSRPFITKDEVAAIKKQATRFQKLRLKFHRSYYALDGGVLIRYKTMGKTIYVMTKEESNE